MTLTLASAPAGSGLKTVQGDDTNVLLQTWLIGRDPLGAYAKLRREYGDLAAVNFLGKRMVIAQGPDAADTILMNRDKAFANAPAWGYLIGPFFRRGILLLDFEEHFDHRRVLQHAFGRPALEGYLAGMQPVIEKRVAQWRPGPGFKVEEEIKALTLEVALKVFVGVDLSPAQARKVNTAFIDASRAGASIIRTPTPFAPLPITAWDRGIRGRKVLEQFFHSHIAEKRRSGGDDLFSQLCRIQDTDGAKFTDEDVVNHMIFVLFAAHDTTTTTMTSIAYHLAKHPQWQQRARAEVRSLPDATTLADLDRFTVLDLCQKEALRLCAPVNALARQAVKDTEILGHHIPADTFVLFPTFVNHYRPDLWPDPERFDPERFTPERKEDKVHKMAWVPFGGGVHKCIGLYFAGMQIKTVFRNLLDRFEWSVPEDYVWPLDLRALPTVKDGLPVHLAPADVTNGVTTA